MGHEVWTRVREEVRSEIGQDAFRVWIEPIEFHAVEAGVANFYVPTQFVGSWVQRNYGELICKTFHENGEKAQRFDFVIRPHAGQVKAPQAAPVAAIESASEEVKDEFPSNPLDPRYKFDRFVVGKSNDLAYAAATRVAREEKVQFNPLFLYGGVGLGKTHLMHAIAWDYKEQNPSARILVLSAEQFMYRFIQALRNKSMIGFKEFFRSVDMLLVDDIQFIGGKDSTQDEFFYTFNALVEQNKQIVISADRAPSDIVGLEERIKSRLQWGLMVDIQPTDYELRLGILQSKSEYYIREHPHIQLQDGVLEFLAQRISSNVRVLEGALIRLFAFADLTGKPANLDLAYECLADILRASQQKLTIDQIMRLSAEHFGIRISDMTGSKRTKAVAYPRQIAMYLSKKMTTKSLPDIGRAFGGRDHTTVLHAVRKIEDLSQRDASIAEDIENLRRKLEA